MRRQRPLSSRRLSYCFDPVFIDDQWVADNAHCPLHIHVEWSSAKQLVTVPSSSGGSMIFQRRGQVLKARGSRPRRRRALGHGERVFPSAPGERCGEGLFWTWCLDMEYFGTFWRVIINTRDLLLHGLKHVLQMYITLWRSRPPQQPVWSVIFPAAVVSERGMSYSYWSV